jgi:hypothetical protein
MESLLDQPSKAIIDGGYFAIVASDKLTWT